MAEIEQEPLLPVAIVSEDEPKAKLFSSIINLSNTILGSGMLAMPSAIAALGLIPGVFCIFISGFLAAFSLYLLSLAAHFTNSRHVSFFAVAQLTYPSSAVFFDIAIAVKCFGVSISYLIIIGDLMPECLRGIGFDAVWLLDRRLWITLFIIILAPICFMKRLDSLRFTSLVALLAVVYCIVIVVFYFFSSDYTTIPDDVKWVRWSGRHFFTSLPIFVFAFTCHQNVFSVYNELRDHSIERMKKVIGVSVGSATFIYLLLGILGYLTYGESVGSNIIAMYVQGTFVTIGRFCVILLVMFSYPLQLHPCRASVEKIIEWTNTRQQTTFTFPLITTAILLSSFLVAISIQRLDLVLSLVGSTGSTTICYM